MPDHPTTTTMRRLTLESADQQDSPQSDVSDATVEMLAPLLQQALDGDDRVPIPPTDYWFGAREITAGGTPGASLRVAFGTASTGIEPVFEMTVMPPGANGAPAIMMASIGGWLEATATGSFGVRSSADRIAYEIADLENCLAWAWLEMRGFADRDQKKANPLEVLFSAGGGMLTTVVQEPRQSPEVCVLVLNTPEAVNQLPQNPQILVQTRLFQVGNVYLVPLVARVGDTWYESWINPHADEGQGLVELEILAAQSRTVFLIYDGTSLEPARTVQIPNPLAQPVAEIRRRLQAAGHWTTEEFATAREELYAAYPTPQDLISGPDMS